MNAEAKAAHVLNVCVLYDPGSVHVNTSREHLEAFARYSRHRITYATAAAPFPALFDLQHFDVVIIHYSIRLAFAWHMAPAVRAAVRAFAGLKLLFVQDEYDNPAITSAAINDLGIAAVFTCVPPAYQRAFYHRVRPQVEFHPVLTGYVSPELEAIRDVPPPSERPIVIGYRGRRLPYRYGKLAQEKYLIGEGMKAICRERNIPHDIESSEDKRIYGDAWNAFIRSCRATLGTESGSNILDSDGTLTARINRLLAWEPGLTFDDVFERLLRPLEGEVVMNQVSPRIFEAIAMRTGLVLFEGTYSGVVQPEVHFIPLKKDFSNVDEVLRRVQDDAFLTALTARAHHDVIESGRYRYSAMVAQVDAVIARVGPHVCGAPARLAPHLMAGLVQSNSGWQLSGLFSAPIDARGLCARPASRLGRIVLAAKAVARKLPPRAKTWTKWVLNRLSPAGWLKVGRSAVVYAANTTARRTLHAYLTHRSVRRRVRLAELWGEILRLDVLTRVLQGKVPSDRAFGLTWSFEPACARLELVSTPATEPRSSQVPSPHTAATPNVQQIDQIIRRAGALEVVWDHSAVGAVCKMTVCRLWIGYPVGSAGMFRFEGLTAVSRRRPELVLRLLDDVIGQQADEHAPLTASKSEPNHGIAAPASSRSQHDQPGEPEVRGRGVRKRAG